ncbi:MAG: dihydroorotate dehydrogenase electron transfer subunit [Candidatus Hydrogenedentes bacterium]|nr:dihydroorotate dehydrogenase electron transfer subunit [Candidatus Hydrogenedentota bacterium]
MRFLRECEILRHDHVALGHYRLVLHAPEIARAARPGQFCMLEVQPGYYPFLRRPMCFERIHGDTISILYKVEGEGTRLMSLLSSGQRMNVQGPLGKPFPLESGYERHILVAGGIGIAPFPALAEAIIRELGTAPEVIIAARSRDWLLCADDFRAMGCEVHLATDDGSVGEKAFASEVLRRLAPGPGSIVYCCGPLLMMKATHVVCESFNVPCLASLEAEMACGDGVCLGCVIQAKVEIEAERMVRVCYDGPVFDTRMIDWAAY